MTVATPERGPVVPGEVESSYYTYNTRYIPPPGPPGPDRTTFGIRVRGYGERVPGWNQPLKVKIPKQVPPFFADRRVIMNTWFAAIIIVVWDEWHNYGILPRPKRLWYTSLTYGLLMLASVADPLVPITNMMAIGFTFVLLYQYYEGAGQFIKSPGAQATGTTQAPGTTTAAGRG